MGLNNMDFPIQFTWLCLKFQRSYDIIRVQLSADSSILLTLTSGEVLLMAYSTPQWIEFTLLLNSPHFVVPRSHGIRGIIAIYKLRRILRTCYEGL